MLEALLLTVVATLAQGLERARPELLDITAMRLDVIADETRRIAFDPAALRALAGKEITHQDLPTQPLPACGLVQRTAWIIAITALIHAALLLGD